MKIPKILRVCGHDIKVEFTNKPIKFDGEEKWACYNDNTHVILLSSNMDETRKMEVILHECLHAIGAIHALGLSENQVKILGIELLGLIRNNKLDLLKTKRMKGMKQ